MAAGGDAAICGAECAAHAGNLRERDERPAPPDISRERDDGVRAAVGFAVLQQDAHLAEKLVLWEMKENADPGGLQGEEDKPARGQNRLDAIDPTAAELAIAVEEDPASRGLRSSVSYFCRD